MSETSSRSVVYTAQFENLDLVRDFVAEAAEACGLEPAAVYGVQLAVDEAFTNIIEHAYGGESDEKIRCDCRIERSALVISLCDCGKPFNPLDVPAPDLQADLEEREVGGLGLYFMNKLMDDVQFAFGKEPETGKTCNILTMVKRKGA
ncbi:MAG: ATP-binding protein [Chloroflexota bacterium]